MANTRKRNYVICIHMPKMMFAVNVLLLDRDRKILTITFNSV